MGPRHRGKVVGKGQAIPQPPTLFGTIQSEIFALIASVTCPENVCRKDRTRPGVPGWELVLGMYGIEQSSFPKNAFGTRMHVRKNWGSYSLICLESAYMKIPGCSPEEVYLF